MFEFSPSQGKSVPTDRQTVLMHRYVLIESHRKTSVALWVHPFSMTKAGFELLTSHTLLTGPLSLTEHNLP